ncbi:MAG TPA: protein-methionine-sulfoxide reductase heme-binding subunit MsrQ [Vicinamibacteria bacterium]|nr:protein-methionine-sulfoxide reductase heme-binding subunit MsrQ [Vicinamibacteria bacterium]
MREPRRFGAVLVFASLLPAAYAIYALGSDILRGTRVLGSNPIKEGEHFLGEWTLRFLVLSLTITPLRQLLRWNWLARHRRTLGLFAFGYGVMHWLVYILLDIQLDMDEMVTDVIKRPYILIGSLGLLLMLPLALTSTKKMIARLGGKRWNRLHKLVYAASVAGVIHFWMSVKADISGPLTFAVIFAVLFAYRLWKWRGSADAGSVTPGE